LLLALDEEPHLPTLDDRHLFVGMVVLRCYEKRLETKAADHHLMAHHHLALDAVSYVLDRNVGPIQMPG
jgi:hypothetical protein